MHRIDAVLLDSRGGRERTLWAERSERNEASPRLWRAQGRAVLTAEEDVWAHSPLSAPPVSILQGFQGQCGWISPTARPLNSLAFSPPFSDPHGPPDCPRSTPAASCPAASCAPALQRLPSVPSPCCSLSLQRPPDLLLAVKHLLTVQISAPSAPLRWNVFVLPHSGHSEVASPLSCSCNTWKHFSHHVRHFVQSHLCTFISSLILKAPAQAPCLSCSCIFST